MCFVVVAPPQHAYFMGCFSDSPVAADRRALVMIGCAAEQLLYQDQSKRGFGLVQLGFVTIRS